MKYYLCYRQYTLISSILGNKTNSGLDQLTDGSQRDVWKTKLYLIPQYFPCPLFIPQPQEKQL